VDLERLIPIVLISLLLLGVRNVRETERVVVFRLGRFLHLQHPGRFWIIPFVDKIARIDLDARIPEWRSLDPTEVDRRVEDLVRSGASIS
jgi:regulator of protease activity HflC (stomatin/prohibitin superfamily)